MAGEDANKLSKIVPEFWHDIIARIVPGFLILIATYPAAIGESEISFGELGLGLLSAYVIGFTFDILSQIVFRLVPRYDRARTKIYDTIDALPAYRDLLIKMFAEAVLFRSLCFYWLLQLIAAGAKLVWPSQLPSEITIYPWWLAVLSTALFSACWWRMETDTFYRMEVLKNESTHGQEH